MSKIKVKKIKSTSGTHKSTVKIKKTEFGVKQNGKETQTSSRKHRKKFAPHEIAPPDDPLHFSTNWKNLQEVITNSPAEKKQPLPQKPWNRVWSKKAKEHSSQQISTKTEAPSNGEAEKKVKHESSQNIVSEKVGVNFKTENTQNPKRKETGNPSGEKAAKKTKLEVEKQKPTEEDLWFDDVDPDDIEETLGPEAAEIMRKKQGLQKNTNVETALVKEGAFDGLTTAVAIDCEMVGVGPDGVDNMLARVSIVNQFGKCIYDKYVKPTERVTDYRTAVSGIRPEDIKDGEDVRTVQREVADILRGRIVVGHAIQNDFKILLLDHPKKRIRDTQKYKPFRKIAGSGRPALRVLCREILHVKVQQGEHSSVQDAQATMRLYTLVKKQWEKEIKESRKNKDSSKKSERKKTSPKKKEENKVTEV